MAKAKERVAGRAASQPKEAAYFPPPGTVLQIDPSAPSNWCAFCRGDRHDICDLAKMTFCECFRIDHEEEL